MADVNENTELNIPLKSLVSLVAITVIATTAYFAVESRLTSIEYQTQMLLVEVEETDRWIDEFQPPKEVQDTIERVRALELKIAQIETKMKYERKD